MTKEWISREKAIELSESKFWEFMTDKEIVEFQLFEDRLCMPWEVFHESLEKCLGRPVYTHEFIFCDLLKKEFLGEKSAPSFEDILNLIPEDKRVILVV